MINSLKVPSLLIFAFTLIIVPQSLSAHYDRQQFISDSKSMYSLYATQGFDGAKSFWDSKSSNYADTDGRYENDMGQLYLSEGKLEEAYTWFEKSSELNSSFPYPHLNVAKILIIQEKYDEASRILSNLMEKLPNWGPAFRWSTELAFRMSDYESAIMIGKKSNGISEHFSTNYFMALSYFEMDKIEESRTHALKAISGNSDLENDKYMKLILEASKP